VRTWGSGGAAWVVVSLIVVAAASFAQGAGAQSPVEDLVDRVQRHYRGVDSLEARFEQFVESRPGMAPRVSGGTWYMRPPGRLRIEYASNGRIFVADGEQTYYYLPADRQVHVRTQDDFATRGSPLMYLTGQGDLRDDFAVSGVEWRTRLEPGNVQLRLEPLSPADYEYLLVEVEPETATVVRLVTFGPFGDVSEFRFYEIVTDVDLADDLFQFTIPDGVEVENLGN